MLDATEQAWNVIEATLLEDFEAWARGRGADEDQITRVRALYEQMLWESIAMLRAAGPPRWH